MHQAHRIEDTNAFDIDRYHYLFNSSDVRIQYNQRGYLKHVFERISKRTVVEKGLKKGTMW